MTDNLGQQQAHAYYRKHQLPLLVYDVRWFKELQQDQVYIGIDAETGEVVNFYTELSEKTPRASLSKAQARELALAFANTKGFLITT